MRLTRIEHAKETVGGALRLACGPSCGGGATKPNRLARAVQNGPGEMTLDSTQGVSATQSPTQVRAAPIDIKSLAEAFENNAAELDSYLNLRTGDVIRVLDGVADSVMRERVMSDPEYLHVDPVPSREQYRWMEQFIATVDGHSLRSGLVGAIAGKGAFRRFKDVLMAYPADRERWFAFRSERIRSFVDAWIAAHGIVVTLRSDWPVPRAEENETPVAAGLRRGVARPAGASVAGESRRRLAELLEILPARELDAAVAYLEFLHGREQARSERAGPRDGC